MSFEVEQKFQVDDLARLEASLEELGAVEGVTEQHRDTYYNHPCRDFAETHEAFRIRRVGDVPMITYKGPKLPGTVKARRELEWRLDPGDHDGSRTEELLQYLSFRRVAVVEKRRRPFALPTPWTDYVVVIDEVAALGLFAEVEAVVGGESDIEPARTAIRELSERLGLHQPESRSYLRMVLAISPPE